MALRRFLLVVLTPVVLVLTIVSAGSVAHFVRGEPLAERAVPWNGEWFRCSIVRRTGKVRFRVDAERGASADVTIGGPALLDAPEEASIAVDEAGGTVRFRCDREERLYDLRTRGFVEP